MAHQSDLTEEIARRLEVAGHGKWAGRLRDAVTGGTTGTEINMALGSTLFKFKLTFPKLDPETKRLIKQLDREIGKALRWR